MSNEFVSPINHSDASAFAGTAAGAASGALKGTLKFGALWIATAAVLGALAVGGGLLLAGVGPLAALGFGALGAVAGGGIGAFSTPVLTLFAGVGALLGGFKGASNASDRVNQERSAAAALDAQVQLYKAQAVTPTTNIYAPSTTRFAAPAHMNAASPMIQGGTNNVQYDGRLAGAELAAAR